MKTYNYIEACTQQQIHLQSPEVETQKKNLLTNEQTYYVWLIQWSIYQHEKKDEPRHVKCG